MTVALVVVGDELLSGRVSDANAGWLGRFLADHGLPVVSTFHVGDDVEATVKAVRRGLDDASYVIVTGGLGPTSDDVTRLALARLTEAPLQESPELVEWLESYAATRGRDLHPAELVMAQLPEGAAALRNPAGSAPGIRVDVAAGVVFAVPGVPREMQAMMAGPVLDELRDAGGAAPTIAVRSIGVAWVMESAIAERLAALEALIKADPAAGIGYLAQPGVVEVRLRVVRADAHTAERDVAAYDEQARGALGADAFEGPSLAAALTTLMLDAGATCATAESLTGGRLAGALTALPGSSRIFRGGVVAYATDLKHDLLGVPSEHLDRFGAVHEQTAALMAEGVRSRCATTYGLATTGVAGPDPQDAKPAGTVYVAVAGPGGTVTRSLALPGDRALIQRLTVTAALDLARRVIAAESPSTTVR